MTIKETAIRAMEELPEGATWDDVQERIKFVAGVRKGLRELDEGKGMPHDRVKDAFCQTEAVIPSPEWHRDVLQAREQRIQAGEAKFVELSAAKRRALDQVETGRRR